MTAFDRRRAIASSARNLIATPGGTGAGYGPIAAWSAAAFDATNSRWTDRASNGRHLFPGSSTAAPVRLPFYGERYMWSAASACYASASATGVTLAGQQWEFEIDVEPDNNGALKALGSLGGATNDAAFDVWITDTGTIACTVHRSGDTSLSYFGGSISSHLGSRVRIRASWVGNNGSGSSQANFYVSTDGGRSWPAVGFDTDVAVTTMPTSATTLQVGRRAAGNTPGGKYYRATWRSGGTLRAYWSCQDMGQTGGSSGGRTWTINRPASGYKTAIVDRAMVVLDGTDDTMSADDHLLFDLSTNHTILFCGRTHHQQSARLVSHGGGNVTGDPGQSLALTTGPAGSVGYWADNSSRSQASGPAPVASTSFWVALRSGPAGAYVTLNGISGATTTLPAGAMDSTSRLHVGSANGTWAFFAGEWFHTLVWRRHVSNEEIASYLPMLGM